MAFWNAAACRRKATGSSFANCRCTAMRPAIAFWSPGDWRSTVRCSSCASRRRTAATVRRTLALPGLTVACRFGEDAAAAGAGLPSVGDRGEALAGISCVTGGGVGRNALFGRPDNARTSRPPITLPPRMLMTHGTSMRMASRPSSYPTPAPQWPRDHRVRARDTVLQYSLDFRFDHLLET